MQLIVQILVVVQPPAAPPAPTPPAPAPTPTAPPPAPAPTAAAPAPRKPFKLIARIKANKDGDVDVAEIVGKADLTDLRALYNRLKAVEAGKDDVNAADIPFDIAADLAANKRAASVIFAPINQRASSALTKDEESVGTAAAALDDFFKGVTDLHQQARKYREARGEKEALEEIDSLIDATLVAAEVRGLAAMRTAAALRAGAATPLFGDVPEVRAITEALLDKGGFAPNLRRVVNKARGNVNPAAPIARVAYGDQGSVPLIIDTAATSQARALSRQVSSEVDKVISSKVKIAVNATPDQHAVLIRFMGEEQYYSPEAYEEILDRSVAEYAKIEQAARAEGLSGYALNKRLNQAKKDLGVALIERRAVEIPESVVGEDDDTIAAALAGGRPTWKPHEVNINTMYGDATGATPRDGFAFVRAPVPVLKAEALTPEAIPGIRTDLSGAEAIDTEAAFPRATTRRRGATIATRSLTEAIDQALHAPYLLDGGGPGVTRTILKYLSLPVIGDASAAPFVRNPPPLRPFLAPLANEVEQGIGDMVVLLRQAPNSDLIYRYLTGEPGLVTPFGVPVSSSGRINAAENARAMMTRIVDDFRAGGEGTPGGKVIAGVRRRSNESPVTAAELVGGAIDAARVARKEGRRFNAIQWLNTHFLLPEDPKGRPISREKMGEANDALSKAVADLVQARALRDAKASKQAEQISMQLAPDFMGDMRKIAFGQGDTVPGASAAIDIPLLEILTDPDPDFGDPDQIKGFVQRLIGIVKTTSLDDIALNRRAVNLVVHLTAYSQTTHGTIRLSRTGAAISPDQYSLISKAISGEYLEDAERAEAERLIRVFGLAERGDMERIDLTGEDIYVPRSAAAILAQAFSKAKPIEIAAFERGTSADIERAKLIGRAASTSIVRGNLFLYNKKMVQDTVDGFFRVLTMTNPSVTARYTARTAAGGIYGLIPGLAPAIQMARQQGTEVDVVGRLADGGQAAAAAIERFVRGLDDAGLAAHHARVEEMLKLGMQRPSVLSVWRGENVIIPTSIGQTTAREARDVAQQYGVLSSFDTSQRVEASLRDMFGMTMREAEANPSLAVSNLLRRYPRIPVETARQLAANALDVVQWSREVTSATMEQFSSMERLSLYVTLLEDGFDPVSAARSTSAILYNYGRTVHGNDRSLFVSLFLPFWAWRKNNNRAVLDLLFTNRGRVALMRARRAQAGIFAGAQSLIDAYTSDEYGIDTDQMTPEQREMYYGMVGALEREHGYPLPADKVAALRAIVSNRVGTKIPVGQDLFSVSGRPNTGATQLAAKFLRAGDSRNPMLVAPGIADERYVRYSRGRSQIRMLQQDLDTASPFQIAALIMQESETAAMIATAVNVMGLLGSVAGGVFNAGLSAAGVEAPIINIDETAFSPEDAERSPLAGQVIQTYQALAAKEADGKVRIPEWIGAMLPASLVTIRRDDVPLEKANEEGATVEGRYTYYVSAGTWAAVNILSQFALADVKREFEMAAQAYYIASKAGDRAAAATAFETMITLLGYPIRRGADERLGAERRDADAAARE